MKKRVHLYVSGKVQGVCYRYYTVLTASKLNIKGWVKNLPDGRVEICAEGEEEKLKELIKWANEGSPSARVKYVDVKWEEYIGEFNNFEVKF